MCECPKCGCPSTKRIAETADAKELRRCWDCGAYFYVPVYDPTTQPYDTPHLSA